MREIKFRAWIPKENRMFTMYNEGFFAHCDNNPDYIVMQFTGLLDKSGVGIYEGDIVKWNHGVGEDDIGVNEIIFQLGSFGLDDGGYIGYDMEALSHGITEVIGNIYSNPELLSDLFAIEGEK